MNSRKQITNQIKSNQIAIILLNSIERNYNLFPIFILFYFYTIMSLSTNNNTQNYLLAGAAAVLTGLVVSNMMTKTSKGIPSVEGGYPFFGHVFTMTAGSPWDTMAKWVQEYGTIYKAHIFGSDAIFVSDPEILKIILQTKINSFKKDLEWTYKPFLVLLGTGIVTSEGQRWLKQRALLSNHLKKEILELIPDMAVKTAIRVCEKLKSYADQGLTIEMAEEFRHITLQVVAEAILSLSPEESDNTFAKMYLPIVQEGNLRTWHPYRMYLPTPGWFQFQRDVATLNNYVTSLIEARWKLRQQEASKGITDRKPDVLDKILSSIKPEDWNQDAIIQIRDEIKTFMLAGHETTASMLAWTMYELVAKSGTEHLETLIAEANKVFEGCRDPTTGFIVKAPAKNQLDQLVFAECCLREGLRKYSVVPTVVRVAGEDIDIKDKSIYIPKGSTIMVCMQGVHHNPNYWPEPMSFKPKRFLQEVEPFTFIPFIEGPRMCLGQYMSVLEAKMLLAILLSTFRFEVVNEEDAGVKHPYMVPIIPKTGHFLRVFNK